MSRDNVNSGGVLSSLAIAALKGALSGMLAVIALAFIFSFLLLAFPDPNAFIGVCAYVTLALCSLFTGIIAVKYDSQRRVSASLVAGAMLALVLFGASLFMRTDASPSILLSVGVYLACIGVSALGGAVGSKKRARNIGTKNGRAALMRRKLASKK